MCFSPSIPKDNSADLAAQSEATREANIKQGQGNIDQAFTQFDDPYYQNISKSYTDYYNPQLDQQYKDALNKLTLNLGQQGILQSSEADRQIKELQQADDAQKQAVASNALNAANSAKQQVAQQKNTLYQLNNTAADPSQAASLAATAASSAVSTPTYSPLANAFAGLVNQGSNAFALQGNSGGGQFYSNNNSTSAPAGTTSAGSSTLVK